MAAGPILRRMSEVAQALSLTSLVAGTLEYAILIRHRQERRFSSGDDRELEMTGREALARARLLDGSTPARSWTAAGTRFR